MMKVEMMRKELFSLGLVLGLGIGAYSQNSEGYVYVGSNIETGVKAEEISQNSSDEEHDLDVITLKGAKVYGNEKIDNATLIGVDSRDINFTKPIYFSGDIHLKGLLFELEDGELLHLVGRSGSYYEGQVYDIEFNRFLEDQPVKTSSLSDLFMNINCNYYNNEQLNRHISGRDSDYEGVLRNCVLKK